MYIFIPPRGAQNEKRTLKSAWLTAPFKSVLLHSLHCRVCLFPQGRAGVLWVVYFIPCPDFWASWTEGITEDNDHTEPLSPLRWSFCPYPNLALLRTLPSLDLKGFFFVLFCFAHSLSDSAFKCLAQRVTPPDWKRFPSTAARVRAPSVLCFTLFSTLLSSTCSRHLTFTGHQVRKHGRVSDRVLFYLSVLGTLGLSAR